MILYVCGGDDNSTKVTIAITTSSESYEAKNGENRPYSKAYHQLYSVLFY